MGAVKEFTSPEAKLFFDVATKDTSVNIANYTGLRKFLSPPFLMVNNKNELIRLYLTTLENIFPDTAFSEGDVDALVNNDLERFKIKAPVGSELKNCESTAKRLAEYNNSLIFNYNVAFQLVEFLETRDNTLLQMYDELKEKYLKLLNETIALKTKEEGERLLVKAIEKNEDTIIKMTEIEKKSIKDALIPSNIDASNLEHKINANSDIPNDENADEESEEIEEDAEENEERSKNTISSFEEFPKLEQKSTKSIYAQQDDKLKKAVEDIKRKLLKR